MKKNLFLFLLLLIFVGRASADAIGANCSYGSDGLPTPLLTNGKFQAIACNVPGLAAVILINGPAGLETIQFGDHNIDAFRSFYLNDRGEVVLSEESVGDRNTLVATYTGPGLINIGGLVPGPSYLPGETIGTHFGSLAMNPGPVFYDNPVYPNIPDEPIGGYPFPSLLATGITDNGTVEALEQYGYDYHPPVSIAATWNFMPTPEPSTWMLVLGAALGVH